MENIKRSWVFEDFACNDDGYSIHRRIHAMARHYVAGHAAKIDPNWHRIEVSFDDMHKPRADVLARAFTDKDACRVEFDYRPTRVLLVGPKVGHVVMTERVFQMIPEPLVMMMRVCDVVKGQSHRLYNPKHEIELVDGKTIIYFENCTSGVVRNVRGDDEEFDVEGIDPHIDLDEDQRHFTRAGLMESFKIEGFVGQPVGVDYFPRLTSDGDVLKTPEDLLEHNRLERERYEAECAAEGVRRESEASVAEAALTPEQRAEREVKNRRLAVEGAMVRALLKVTPNP